MTDNNKVTVYALRKKFSGEDYFLGSTMGVRLNSAKFYKVLDRAKEEQLKCSSNGWNYEVVEVEIKVKKIIK